MKKLNENELETIWGGVVNPNMKPNTMNKSIDSIINGKNYDIIAQLIVDKILQPPEPRKRNVNNSVDINDYNI